MDAYRTAAFSCPACSAPLREYSGRLVCDACGGLLLAVDDLTHAIFELDNVRAPLEITDQGALEVHCPRCTRPMQGCIVAKGKLRIRGRTLHCERDGLWVTQDGLTAVFERAFRGTQRGSEGQAMGGLVSTSVGSASDSSAHTHRRAAGQLAISRWSQERPFVHTPHVSAFRDRTLGCPACASAVLDDRGDRWLCAKCSGAFVENAVLTAMIANMAGAPWELPPPAGEPGGRACPVCSATLDVEALLGVTVDRCGEHGVWFDERELQDALEAAAPRASGLGAWLRRLLQS